MLNNASLSHHLLYPHSPAYDSETYQPGWLLGALLGVVLGPIMISLSVCVSMVNAYIQLMAGEALQVGGLGLGAGPPLLCRGRAHDELCCKAKQKSVFVCVMLGWLSEREGSELLNDCLNCGKPTQKYAHAPSLPSIKINGQAKSKPLPLP